jgi:hypothetical protein
MVPVERFELSNTVSKAGHYSNLRTLALWWTGKDLNLRVPLGKTGLQPVRFGLVHAPVQTWRNVDESNAHRQSPITMPLFQDHLPTIQQYVPHGPLVLPSRATQEAQVHAPA